MNIKQLASLVREMRTAQKEYFKSRSPQTLSLSKELERHVDREVSEILDSQGRLFTED